MFDDRGDVARCFRDAMQANGIQLSISIEKFRDKSLRYGKRRYRRRSRIVMMSGCLKDWRRVASR
ncbi:hypothetical protein [Sphingomonas sp. GM_Shp_2]|uniref:hypothetical protein n=1 Tax=Sphingomonas sp. GM_Shp_2 TaxID=2937380 RepID=UPI00226AE7B1|nr:hypothetical protein [Sphingomonas sp. GM_Shp_2]